MKITKIETHKCWVDWCNMLFVKVSTDEGLYGWGEGSMHGPVQAVETAIHELGQVLMGHDPSGVERHWQRLYHGWRWRGGAVQATAMAALDIALWDLEGKRLGVPVHRLLGGPYRERIPVYASHWLQGADTPEKVQAGVREALALGYTAFKWSPFRPDALRENEGRALRQATELMAAAREAAGPDTGIFVECAEKLSPRTAVLAGRLFEPYRPGFFEEPIPFENAAAMVNLQRELPVPIATGERLLSRWEFRELLTEGGCKIIQPDLMHAMGITEVKRIAAMADTYYIPVAPHNSGGPIVTLATMHLIASIPNFFILEQMERQRTTRDRLCTHPVTREDGCFLLPQTPGLGTDLDEDYLKSLPFEPQPFSDTTESLWR